MGSPAGGILLGAAPAGALIIVPVELPQLLQVLQPVSHPQSLWLCLEKKPRKRPPNLEPHVSHSQAE